MGPLVIPLIAAGASLVGKGIEWLSNRKATMDQNRYNSPKKQRQRLEAAGYNPNLFYQQGNVGNQSQAVQTPSFSQIPAETVQAYNQTRMTSSQVTANDARTAGMLASTELTKIKTAVEASNPLLDKNYLDALIASMKSSAEIKAFESNMQGQEFERRFHTQEYYTGGNALKYMNQELENLEQRFDLGTADKAIKAQVLKSKEFQNAILEVQKKFMENGEITPQHFIEFTKLLLMKLLN